MTTAYISQMGTPMMIGRGLKGEYYSDENLTGTLFQTRIDSAINFMERADFPVPESQNAFSVRWTGKISAPVDGNYQFSTVVDDGIRLFLNGVQMIEQWNVVSQTMTYACQLSGIKKGQDIDIRLEYFQHGGPAVLQLLWQHPDPQNPNRLITEPVPNDAFGFLGGKPIDLAHGMPVTCSSHWPGYLPSRANDNTLPTVDTDHGWASTAISYLDPSPDNLAWWQVDLGEPCQISRIELVARQNLNQPANRRNFEIRAANNPRMRDSVVLGAPDRPLAFKETWKCNVTTTTPYRYIRATKTQREKATDGDHEFFIAQLRIWGYEL